MTFQPVVFPKVAPQPALKENELPYNEYFHSIQGEGEFIGKRVIFFRLPLCSLRCVFCDSVDAVSGINTQVISYDELTNYACKEHQISQIVWTGGEPTLNFKRIAKFYDYLWSLEKEGTLDRESIPQFAFETNGLHFVDLMTEYPFYYTVSPKMGVSGQGHKINLGSFSHYLKSTQCGFKFVVQKLEELQEIQTFLKSLNVGSETKITFQPEWYQFEALESVQKTGDYWKPYHLFMKELIEHLLADKSWNQYDWHVLPQMHKMFWGNVMGV